MVPPRYPVDLYQFDGAQSLSETIVYLRLNTCRPSHRPCTPQIRYLQSKLAIGFRTRLTRYVHDLYLSDKVNFYKVRPSPPPPPSVMTVRSC